MWRNFFEVGAPGEERRKEQKEAGKPISSMHLHWVASVDIKRPAKNSVMCDTVEGISSSYQFFMHKQGEVLMSSHCE